MFSGTGLPMTPKPPVKGPTAKATKKEADSKPEKEDRRKSLVYRATAEIEKAALAPRLPDNIAQV